MPLSIKYLITHTSLALRSLSSAASEAVSGLALASRRSASVSASTSAYPHAAL